MSCDEADYLVLLCSILPTKCMSFIDVGTDRTVVACDRVKRLDRAYDIADVGALGDAVNVGDGSTDEG
jgi:hypothetical protein